MRILGGWLIPCRITSAQVSHWDVTDVFSADIGTPAFVAYHTVMVTLQPNNYAWKCKAWLIVELLVSTQHIFYWCIKLRDASQPEVDWPAQSHGRTTIVRCQPERHVKGKRPSCSLQFTICFKCWYKPWGPLKKNANNSTQEKSDFKGQLWQKTMTMTTPKKQTNKNCK